MNIQETNFFEIILRNIMIGMTIYNDFEDGSGRQAIVIKNLIYDPLISQVYISDNIDPDAEGANNYKLDIKENFEFDYEILKKVIPNKKRLRGRRRR